MFPSFPRRSAIKMLALAVTLAGVGSAALADPYDEDAGDARRGKLFMSTNAAAGNAVQVYAHPDDGPPVLLQTLPTGGQGTGAGLGSQGALAISTSGKYLFVVNAGSDSVSTFILGSKGATLASTAASGGSRPISVAESDGIVYVLNAPASGIGNVVAGFRNDRGTLVPLADGVRGLQDGSAPAQVAFARDGDTVVISEKAANQLVSYAVGRDGTLSTSHAVTPSPGAVPFGFDITKRDVVVVSEAGTSSATSYKIGHKSEPLLATVTPALANGQGAACWVSVTPDGRFAYTANATTSNVSLYGIDKQGALTLLSPQAGLTAGHGALDMAVTPDGRQLHVYAPQQGPQIVSFGIAKDGGLTKIGTLDVGSGAGLAAN
jgi:6-phosphogluconolactonase (cycloisomerase 2 family)